MSLSFFYPLDNVWLGVYTILNMTKWSSQIEQQAISLYIDECLSVPLVAPRLGVSEACVYQHLRKAGVAIRSIGEAGKLAIKLGYKPKPPSPPSGANSPLWKGGRRKRSDGYIAIACPNHPHAKSGVLLEHRVIMEQYLGRYLLASEIVHHINGIRDDNRIKNLSLTTGRKEHKRIHPNVVCPHCKRTFVLTNCTPVGGFI